MYEVSSQWIQFNLRNSITNYFLVIDFARCLVLHGIWEFLLIYIYIYSSIERHRSCQFFTASSLHSIISSWMDRSTLIILLCCYLLWWLFASSCCFLVEVQDRRRIINFVLIDNYFLWQKHLTGTFSGRPELHKMLGILDSGDNDSRMVSLTWSIARED